MIDVDNVIFIGLFAIVFKKSVVKSVTPVMTLRLEMNKMFVRHLCPGGIRVKDNFHALPCRAIGIISMHIDAYQRTKFELQRVNLFSNYMLHKKWETNIPTVCTTCAKLNLPGLLWEGEGSIITLTHIVEVLNWNNDIFLSKFGVFYYASCLFPVNCLVPLVTGAAVAEWLSSWLAEQEDRGSIPRLATWIFRDWLSPASKSRYGWKIAKSTLIKKQPTNQPTKPLVTDQVYMDVRHFVIFETDMLTPITNSVVMIQLHVLCDLIKSLS